jgi:hypothetical protein
MRKRVKLRRGETTEYEYDELKGSKVLAIDNRFFERSSNADISNRENLKRLNKSS